MAEKFARYGTLPQCYPGSTTSEIRNPVDTTSENLLEQMTKNAAFDRGLDRFDERDRRGSWPCRRGGAR